jgi:hypothetical protein
MRFFIKLIAAITSFLFPVVYKLFGGKGIKAWQLVFYQIGVDRSSILKNELKIDINDARSLGYILDYDDSLGGVKGIWEMEKKGKAIKVVRICPLSNVVRSEMCLHLIAALEAGTFYTLNPRIKVPDIPKLISRGDDCCIATIELPYLAKEAADQVSPYSTGKKYPVINIPGLNRLLFYQTIKSFLKAVLNLHKYGTKQQMYWYEFFRYKG